MSKAKPLMFGAALGASAMFFAQQYHVVHSHDGLQVIPRTPQQSIGLAYADIRNWGPSQWTDRPELARALMAHGSTDLISESVASTLADRVSEDTSTLDELRGFINGSKKSDRADTGDDLFDAPSSGTRKATESAPNDESDSDLFRIPFPQDAKAKLPADPFAKARVAEIIKPIPSNTGSRFSSEEVLDGLREAPFEEEILPPTRSSSAVTSKPKSVTEQANEAIELIWGKPTPNPTKTTAPKPAPKAIPKPAETDFMFEEVTTQLENRAQEALTRARTAATEQAASSLDNSAKASSNYVRDRAAEMMPDAAKSLLNGGLPDPSRLATTPKLDFDPFLE